MNKKMTTMEYAKAACNTIMKKFSVEELPIAGKFHYHQGVFLSGMERVFFDCGEEKYNQYIKDWVDCIINSDGVITNYDKTSLDDFMPAVLLYRLAKTTDDIRYERAIKTIKKDIDGYKVNKYGGFYHKEESTPGQMWLDGLYMASPFLAMYAKKYGEEKCYEIIYTQMKLMWEHCRDAETGLLYHAWDSTNKAEWADKETGLAPCFWGRAMGWYVVALCDILDYTPDEWEHKAEFIKNIKACAEALIKYVDKKTGCWYQVIDKIKESDNWIEVSCSCLFTYFISKAIRKGYIDDMKYTKFADKAFEGILSFIKDNGDGTVDVTGVCIGTGVGEYDYYINRPVSVNDLHGVGAFVLCCSEYNELKKIQCC